MAIPLPAGYDYDFANLDALRESRCEDGWVRHASGMRYRFLMMPGTGRATPALMREVLRLAEAGAAVAAPRGFSHAHGMASDEQVAGLWKQVLATGRAVVAPSFGTVEERLLLVPDFGHQVAAELLWIHRTDDSGADWYFVSNQSDEAFEDLCDFRVTGRQPELWDAATGRIRDVARFREHDGRTTVQIPFDARGSWFIVFRKPASTAAVKPNADELAPAARGNAASSPRRGLWIEEGRVVEEIAQPGPRPLDGPWDLTFQPNRGAPASARLDRLIDLSRHDDEGIRHFSGTVAYRTSFALPQSETRTSSSRRYLDLGEVYGLAEVIVNGRNLGVLWKRPFRTEVTDALKTGENEVEVRVTTLWVNRLIGDAKKMAALGVQYADRNSVISKWPEWVGKDSPIAGAPVTFATWRQWTGDEPLQPAGLAGPVTLQVVARKPLPQAP